MRKETMDTSLLQVASLGAASTAGAVTTAATTDVAAEEAHKGDLVWGK